MNDMVIELPLSHPQTLDGMLQVIRRNGNRVEFNPDKIVLALSKAFLAVHGEQSGLSSGIREQIRQLTDQVVVALSRRRPSGGSVHIEDIQDQVELALMRTGEHDVARAYVLYREKRAQQRTQDSDQNPLMYMIDRDGIAQPLTTEVLKDKTAPACSDLEGVSAQRIVELAIRDVYDGISVRDVQSALILAARSLIEREPAYNYATARLLLIQIQQEVLSVVALPDQNRLNQLQRDYFPQFIRKGINAGLLDQRLAQFDLERLATALDFSRDLQFGYLGLQTLYDRYFLHCDEQRIELPQLFFMRVAMGLSLLEIDREARAIEFYQVLSRFDFMSSTPTLFNSGTVHSQLSSCYLTTVRDDLDGIYQSIKDNAMLQKYAGGLGNDWTSVRALGARIRGTNGKSQGVIPFLKVVNDTAVAVNQGGKRKGAVCAYLETWHLDIEEFLDLRKNTGDDRRRTHDMNTANWVPDLFMRRVIEQQNWTLFSPSDVPDLHDRYGKDFETVYCAYEQLADSGKITLFKRIPAVQLWRKMLTMLFETGHPWITFKDPCNIRSPQQHVGIVHSSNLCTEITLNTSEQEIAVCNLGSINLRQHLKFEQGQWQLDQDKIKATVTTAMRMLDNVIDLNFYAVGKARTSNLRHRPVGLGLMGFQDTLYTLRIPYASDEAVAFADRSMEVIAFHAYAASCQLAQERGSYSSFRGSLWDQGILPLDTLDRLQQERGGYLDINREAHLDWSGLRERIQKHGMRNSNCLAIAPTATISNIIGVSASIEPEYQNLYVKSNLSGEFTVVNEFLVQDLKDRQLWDEVMVADLKYYDGVLNAIERIPDDLKSLYKTAFEMDPVWLVEAAARRQKWIDQAQSLNIYCAAPSGRKLSALYQLAWQRGLKTTYYLRSLGATSAEKSTGQGGELNAVQAHLAEAAPVTNFCSIDNPDCESCQ